LIKAFAQERLQSCAIESPEAKTGKRSPAFHKILAADRTADGKK